MAFPLKPRIRLLREVSCVARVTVVGVDKAGLAAAVTARCGRNRRG